MTVLLDTHILLWALADPDRLTEKQASAIQDPTNSIIASSVSIAEIAIKSSIGKLTIDRSLESDHYHGLLAAIEGAGIELIDYSAVEAALLRDLPYHHRDPFDRMLVTQALSRTCTVATIDARFELYTSKTLR